ncbi:MAG: amidohydrolase [Armatimonadetes bacterium]|nr:amidohydrolase [Armatimonadota bacterium]
MGYIDGHVHVWTDDLAGYPLAAGYAVEQMRPPTFTPAELLAHAQPCGVDRIVLIQMSFYGTDNSYMLDAIARYPEVFRGVAIVDHADAELAERVARLRAGGVRGFRVYQLAGGDTPPLDAPEYADLCGVAGELGMAVCPLIDVPLLSGVGRAADRFPATTFVIDHLARIGAGRPIEPADVDALCALAEHPNCVVKASAFYALGAGKAPYDDLVPLIRRVWEAFGAERMMWATDCPYQVQSETYGDSLALIRDRLPFLTDGDRAAILEGTAARVFFSP